MEDTHQITSWKSKRQCHNCYVVYNVDAVVLLLWHIQTGSSWLHNREYPQAKSNQEQKFHVFVAVFGPVTTLMHA